MDAWIARYKQRVMSRCEHDGPPRANSTQGAAEDKRNPSAHFSNVVTAIESKRRQIIERVLEGSGVSLFESGDSASRLRTPWAGSKRRKP